MLYLKDKQKIEYQILKRCKYCNSPFWYYHFIKEDKVKKNQNQNQNQNQEDNVDEKIKNENENENENQDNIEEKKEEELCTDCLLSVTPTKNMGQPDRRECRAIIKSGKNKNRYCRERTPIRKLYCNRHRRYNYMTKDENGNDVLPQTNAQKRRTYKKPSSKMISEHCYKCTGIIKSGPDKGKYCNCTFIGGNFCGRHKDQPVIDDKN